MWLNICMWSELTYEFVPNIIVLVGFLVIAVFVSLEESASPVHYALQLTAITNSYCNIWGPYASDQSQYHNIVHQIHNTNVLLLSIGVQ